jgi:hypothetical protein
LIKDNTSEVLPLVLDLCLKMDPSGNHTFLLKHVSDSTEIITFIINLVEDSTTSLMDYLSKDKEVAKSEGFLKHEPALVWMALHCFPYVVTSGADHSERAWEFAVALEDCLAAHDKGSPLVDTLDFCLGFKNRVCESARNAEPLPVRINFEESGWTRMLASEGL